MSVAPFRRFGFGPGPALTLPSVLKTAPFPALKRGQSKGIQHAVSSRPSNDGANLREPIRMPRPHPLPLLPRSIPSHRQCMPFTVASPPDKPRDPLAMRDVKCSCMLRAARAWNQPWSLCRRRHGRRVGSGETWWTKSGSKLPYRRVVGMAMVQWAAARESRHTSRAVFLITKGRHFQHNIDA